MDQITRLLSKILVVIALSAITLYFIFQVLSPYGRNKSSYVAASLDKEHRLRTIKSPRIVFVGGSNLALGMNCCLLSEKIHYPVVNMGLHAGLGLDFILNESIVGIQSGDIVILSIEHYLEQGNRKLMGQLVDINPTALSLMNLSLLDRIRLLISQLQLCITSTFYKLIKRDKDPIYYREAFNNCGDLTSHFTRSKPNFIGGNIKFSNLNYTDAIIKINVFIEKARGKGAQVYFTFPAFSESAFKNNLKSLDRLNNEYRNSLKCPILGDIQSSILPDRYFYDTVYHLDSIGVQERTKIMLNMLNKLKL